MVAGVNNFLPVSEIRAASIELNNDVCKFSPLSVTLKINAREDTNTSRATNADISATPTLQSNPKGVITG